PEQVRGGTVDRRADIWAFGCVLYELLTGKRAFSGDSTPDIIASVLKSDPDWTALPEETPAKVREFLKRCLDKDTARRLSDIADAHTDLQPDSESAARPSLAVLPFVNAGGNPEMDYLSDGLTESIILSLAQSPELRVMSRSAVFRFKNR